MNLTLSGKVTQIEKVEGSDPVRYILRVQTERETRDAAGNVTREPSGELVADAIEPASVPTLGASASISVSC